MLRLLIAELCRWWERWAWLISDIFRKNTLWTTYVSFTLLRIIKADTCVPVYGKSNGYIIFKSHKIHHNWLQKVIFLSQFYNKEKCKIVTLRNEIIFWKYYLISKLGLELRTFNYKAQVLLIQHCHPFRKMLHSIGILHTFPKLLYRMTSVSFIESEQNL